MASDIVKPDEVMIVQNDFENLFSSKLKSSPKPSKELKKTLYDIQDFLTEPKFSPNALEILQKRYLNKEEGEKEETAKDLLVRVAWTIAQIEELYGTPFSEILEESKKFYNVMANLEFFPNSPTLRGAGRKIHQLAACFVIPIDDSIEGIFDALKTTALVHKGGGGTGFSFGRLRPSGDKVGSTGGVAGGPISFMRIFDTMAHEVMQGGVRVGANMGILPVWHPDIEEWIVAKADGKSFSNFNLSVAATDDFMKKIAHNDEFELKNPRTKKVVGTLKAGDVFDNIIQNAWKNGDPGIIFIDKMNKDNPTPELGEIESTNPCVVGDTLILTDKGMEKIENVYHRFKLGGTPTTILTDDRVIGYDHISRRPITKIFNLGKKTIIKIIAKSGYELEATTDHKLYTHNGWVALKDIKIGDKVFMQKREGQFNKSSLLPININQSNGRGLKLNLPNEWSKELGQMLGLLIGDGWLREGDKNCRVGLTFSKEDTTILNYAQCILNNWYNRPIKPAKRENGVWHLSYHAKNFVEFFKNLGVKALPAAKKTVPQSIFTAPKEAVVGFLQGLFTADGTVNFRREHSSYVRLTSKSLKLLKEVQIILLNFGIKTRVYDRTRQPRQIFPYTTKNGTKKTYYVSGELYELEISRKSVLKFIKNIGFIKNKHSLKLLKFFKKNFYQDCFEEEIDSKEILGKKEVYDLTEPVTYSFITNGFISLDCGEQPLLPHESCNLGSINLAQMVSAKGGSASGGKGDDVDWEKLKKVTHIATRFMDNVIDANRYFVPKIEEMTKGNRKIGLGVMGFADMLVQLGIAYNSEAGIKLAEKIMKFVQEEGIKESEALAISRGPFPNISKSIFKSKTPRRNATITTIAPTGTLSLLGGCAGGIEPFFAIVINKKSIWRKDGTAELEQIYVNPIFEKVAKKEGFYSPSLMEKISKEASIAEIEEIPEKIRKVFVTAHDITPVWHIKMQAAFQKGTDNAVSKTINFPNSAAVDDIKNAYLLAYKLNCKGLTVYRDGSRDNQVLTVAKDKEKPLKEPPALRSLGEGGEKIMATGAKIVPRERPDIIHGCTYRIKTAYGKLFITINDDENGQPFEIFSQIGKAGGFFAAKTEAICRLISLALRSGVDPNEIVAQIKGIRGPTPTWGEEGKMILSLPDAIAQTLEKHLAKDQAKLDLEFETANQLKLENIDSNIAAKNLSMSNGFSSKPKMSSLADYGDAPACPECGGMLELGEGCLKCNFCGYSKCS